MGVTSQGWQDNAVSKIELQTAVFQLLHNYIIHLLALFGAEMIPPVTDIAFAEVFRDIGTLGNPIEVGGLVRGHGFETAQGDDRVN